MSNPKGTGILPIEQQRGPRLAWRLHTPSLGPGPRFVRLLTQIIVWGSPRDVSSTLYAFTVSSILNLYYNGRCTNGRALDWLRAIVFDLPECFQCRREHGKNNFCQGSRPSRIWPYALLQQIQRSCLDLAKSLRKDMFLSRVNSDHFQRRRVLGLASYSCPIPVHARW